MRPDPVEIGPSGCTPFGATGPRGRARQRHVAVEGLGGQTDAFRPCEASPTGIEVSDAAMTDLDLSRDDFHGGWNDTLRPRPQKSG